MPAATDARAYLASLETFGIKLGLATMRQVCAKLAHPEQAWDSVHVAGTNGKGSAAAMIEEALRATGYETGCYTSPHLVRLEERVRINGSPVDAAALDEAVLRVRSAVAALQGEGALDVHPTFFEVTTAAAFELFRTAGVETAVLEVGLGGRFDATNVVTPRVAAITSIALDHEQHLGQTLAAIAYEKAGVIKAGRPIVVGRLDQEAGAVVSDVAASRAAPLIVAHEACEIRTARDEGRTRLRLATPLRDYGQLTLALRGEHQVENAVVATRVLETLAEAGRPVAADAIRQGLEHARWPARLDLRTWSDGRRVLLDGAHNPSGAAALAAYVRAEWPEGRPLVFGAMRDKRLEAMLHELRDVARPLVLTEAPGPRAASLELLLQAAHVAGIADPAPIADVRAALVRAWEAGDPIVVAGSLYLAGRVLELGGWEP